MSSSTTIRVPIKVAYQAALNVLIKAGTPEDTASAVVDVIIDAERRGHASHGLALISLYVDRLRHGGIDPLARPLIHQSREAVIRIDARGGFGQCAAALAASHAAQGAKKQGISAAAVYNCNHIGMLAAYRGPFCDSDIVGLILNLSGPSVAPPGGTKATIGNDALCLIVPRSDNHAPLICDMATGQVACGKIRARASRGEEIPSHWLLDSAGRATTDPRELDRGGSVPVFGGYKGLVVQVIVEMLAGALAGGRISAQVNRQRASPNLPQHTSQLFVGFDPKAFGGANLGSLADRLSEAVSQSLPDYERNNVFFPEQAEQAAWTDAETFGLEIDLDTANFLDVGSS